MSSTVTVEQLFKGLLAHDATQLEAAGVSGSAVSEVGPNTPNLSPGSLLRVNYWESGCCGFCCWEPVYWNPPRPTGDAITDMNNQIAYLKATGGFARAYGSTATAAGENFAHTYEACAECMIGGPQYVSRGEQAAAIYRLAQENHWAAPARVYPKGVIEFTGECDLASDSWKVTQQHGTAEYGNMGMTFEAEVAVIVRKGGNHAWHMQSVSDRKFNRPAKVTGTKATGEAKFKGSWDLRTGHTTIERVEGKAHFGDVANAWAAVLQLVVTDSGKKHKLQIERIDRHTKPLT